MDRRVFLGALAGLLAAPLAAEAQPAGRIYRIGYLGYSSPALEQVGAKRERFPELAAELIRMKVDVIVTLATPAALAAKQATDTIPIVVAAMADPVEDGLVASLARPGGNITGSTFLGPRLVPKRPELLKQVVPRASRVAVLWHPGIYSERTMRDMLQETEGAARAVGVQLQLVGAGGPDEHRGPRGAESIASGLPMERGRG